MTGFLASPLTKGAISGIVAAATVDLHAFLKWQSIEEAAAYNWKLAAWRWLQGAVTGAISAAGYGALVG